MLPNRARTAGIVRKPLKKRPSFDELARQRQRVDELLAAEDTAERHALANADDTAKRDFWGRRFATLNR